MGYWEHFKARMRQPLTDDDAYDAWREGLLTVTVRGEPIEYKPLPRIDPLPGELGHGIQLTFPNIKL